MASKSTLILRSVNAFYGRTQILFNISMDVEEGKVTGLVGRIGAGKTTCFRTIMGMVEYTGIIEFDGQDLRGRQIHEIANLGVGYVPEDRRLYSEMTAEENLKVGVNNPIKERIEMVYELFPRLKERRYLKAKFLSGGEQKMLAIARTLMHNPRLLLIDEVFEGLALPMRAKIMEAIQRMKEKKITFFIAESTFSNLRYIADVIYVIQRGQIVFRGDVQETERFISDRPFI